MCTYYNISEDRDYNICFNNVLLKQPTLYYNNNPITNTTIECYILYIIYTAGHNSYCAEIEFEPNQYLLALSNRNKFVHRDRYCD